MELNELIRQSPVRIFEQFINGGLKPGEVGVIASPNGVGKTSVLVQLALDKLLQGKKVIHVSFTQQTQYVPLWYEDIFNEFISRKKLENAEEIKNNLVKNRVQMHFSQDGVTKDQILRSLRAMLTEGGFKADSIIIDGFDFARAGETNILKTSFENVKTFAKELDLTIWYSCSVSDGAYDKENIPVVIGGIAHTIDVVVNLQPKTEYVEFSVSKDRDSMDSKSMSMKLDPKTLLILEA